MKALTLLTVVLAAAPAFAQVARPPVISPGALQQLRMDEEERRRQIERLEQKPVVPVIEVPADKPAVKADPNGVSFFINQIRFTPSEIFSEDELKAFARDFEGREQTLADLQVLTTRINAAYRARGVVTAQALIPPQSVSGGIVEIRLVEGRVGSILLDGNASTESSYITGRIGLKPGDLVDLPVLEGDMTRFNRTNDIQLQADLVPGSAFATTDLKVLVVEPQRNDLRLTIDNNGSHGTGEGRVGLAYFNHSLFGYRDEFSLSTTQADGQQSYSLGYAIPVNRSGGRLNFGYFQDYTQIKHGPFSTLDITGESTSGVLSYRQPVYLDKTSQVDVVAGTKKRRTDNWVSGVFLNRTETLDGSLGVEAQHADEGGYWMGNFNYIWGKAEVLDTSHYSTSRGWLRRQQALGNDWSVMGNLSFQNHATHLLPSAEQIIIGGEGSVRGYPLGTYGGETGYTATLELHHPIGTATLADGVTPVVANGFFFVDYGKVKPFRPPSSTLRTYEQLTSVGWGMNTALGKKVSARTTVGYALDSIPQGMPSRYTLQIQLIANLF